MATKAELDAKIEKAKANKLLPENLKKKIIEKAQNELIELHQKELKGRAHLSKKPAKKVSKAEMEKQFGKKIMASKDKGTKKTYSEKSDKKKDTTFVVFDSNGKPDSMQISEDAAKKYISRRPKASQSEMKYKEMSSVEAKKIFTKKGMDYDCDELIAKEKARHASSKKSAKKSPAEKSEKAIDTVVDAIENKVEEGELTKAQLLKMIQKLRKEIKHLETLLKTAK